MGAGGAPTPGTSSTIHNALFNSIQAPVYHWVPTPGRNPVFAPVMSHLSLEDDVLVLPVLDDADRLQGTDDVVRVGSHLLTDVCKRGRKMLNNGNGES